MSATATDIINRVPITEIYTAMGGAELRSGRGKAFWRDGDGFNVSFDDSRGVWHDFATDEGGGVLDLVVRVRDCTRADALKWCAELAGVSLEDRPLAPEDRERWARERRELERDLPAAGIWRRAAIEFSEELLTVLKAALFDGPADKIDFDGIRDTTHLLSRLQRIDGTALVAEYHWWVEHYPGMTGLMVQAGMRCEEAERRALVKFLQQTEEKAAV